MVVEPSAQIATTAILGAYPWLAAVGVLAPHWRLWLFALAADAIWLLLRAPEGSVVWSFISGFSLLGLTGAAATQLLAVFGRIVQEDLGADYHILATLIRGASLHPFSPVENMWFVDETFLTAYFDPLTPLVNRLFDLTHDPFRLLAFHSTMVLTGPLLVWWIARRRAALRAFQLAFPVALLTHPAMSSAMVDQYHQSEVAVGLLLLGSYWFFLDKGHGIRAFVPLLLGTLFKVSYWPSWLMFGVICAFRRQWRWTAAYGSLGAAALLLFELANRAAATPSVAVFLGMYGATGPQILLNLLVHPASWLHFGLQPGRWLFFGALLLPLGFCVLAYPPAIIPVLPLVVLTLIDDTGTRSILTLEYATEYIGYLVGGSLVGLAIVSCRLRLAVLVFLAFGSALSLQPSASPNEVAWTNTTLARVRRLAAGYSREAAFGECAVGQAPVLTTVDSWVTYLREYPERVWRDPGNMRLPEATWKAFETVVSPHDPASPWSFSQFPNVASGYDVAHYQELFDRLPVHVLTPRGSRWDYWGGQRLANCAARFGYEVLSPASARPTPGGQAPTASQIAGYAKAVGITEICTEAYLRAHDNQFPDSVGELANFKSFAPADALCG